jgi:hypothetical protein
MYHLVYVSSAINVFTDQQLGELLEVSRRKNIACAVTGLLLYISGNFIQLLEGEQADVTSTLARIKQDPRHRGIITLLNEDCEKRDCADWSMGFEKVDGPDAKELPGYSDFLQQDTDESSRHSAALRLLEFFKTVNR